MEEGGRDGAVATRLQDRQLLPSSRQPMPPSVQLALYVRKPVPVSMLGTEAVVQVAVQQVDSVLSHWDCVGGTGASISPSTMAMPSDPLALTLALTLLRAVLLKPPASESGDDGEASHLEAGSLCCLHTHGGHTGMLASTPLLSLSLQASGQAGAGAHMHTHVSARCGPPGARDRQPAAIAPEAVALPPSRSRDAGAG
jgi:hypothetical protein